MLHNADGGGGCQIFRKKHYEICVSEDMSPYCSAHDEWLIMKLCMYVGYHHDANNGRIRLGDFRGALLGHVHLHRSRLCSTKICKSNMNRIVFLSKMTDQMETRKRKLINSRPIAFILDDDDDVDNCNAVAHIEQDIFLSNYCANCGTIVYISCIIAQLYRPSTYDSLYICLHLNWNSGDELPQMSRFVHNKLL